VVRRYNESLTCLKIANENAGAIRGMALTLSRCAIASRTSRVPGRVRGPSLYLGSIALQNVSERLSRGGHRAFHREKDMNVRALTSSTAQRVFSRAASFAIFLAAFALVLLVAAPLAWRIGLLPLKVSFLVLTGADLVGMAAAILAALGLIFARRSLGWPRVALLSCVVLLGVACVGVPWYLRHNHTPPINDITTDTVDPPAIITALADRQAEHAGTAIYAGPSLAEQQKAAYPDIVPMILTMPVAKAFSVALTTADAMPGWHIIAVDPRAGRIEATQASFWFGFVDDIVIRVEPTASGSRIDMRSHARQGRGDLGVNAARIRRYMAALRGEV
jgi:uncharacterized protein (DUF1499 family)